MSIQLVPTQSSDMSEQLIGNDGLNVSISSADPPLSCWQIIRIYLQRLWAHPTTQTILIVISILFVTFGYPVGCIGMTMLLSPNRDEAPFYYIVICFGGIIGGIIVGVIGWCLYHVVRHCLQCCREIQQEVQAEIRQATLTPPTQLV